MRRPSLAPLRQFAAAALAAALLSAGCASGPAQPKPAEFVTGRAAFQKLFIAARGWARCGAWWWPRARLGHILRFFRIPYEERA